MPDLKIQEALNKTIDAYKALIGNPRKEKSKWEFYGGFSRCRLCKAVRGDIYFDDCSKCPLYEKECLERGCVEATFCRLKNLLKYGGSDSELAEAAEDRLAFIKNRAKENGFKVED